MHASDELMYNCIKCKAEQSLVKLLTRSFSKKPKTNIKTKVGQITEEFIDSSRQDLEKHREELIIKRK